MRKENPSNLICFASRVSEQSLRFGKVKSKDSIWTQTSSPKTTFSKLLCAICRTGVVWHYILCNGRNVSTGRGFDVPHILAWHAVGRTSFNLFIFERDDETQSNVKVQSKTCPKQVKRRKNLQQSLVVYNCCNVNILVYVFSQTWTYQLFYNMEFRVWIWNIILWRVYWHRGDHLSLIWDQPIANHNHPIKSHPTF